MTPGYAFATMLADELETVTVLAGGYTTGTDDAGNPIRVEADSVDVENVDIQPMSGSSRVVPEAVRVEASYQAYVDLSEDATAKRAALKAGRTIQRASGQELRVTWVGDWSTHLLLALSEATGAAA